MTHLHFTLKTEKIKNPYKMIDQKTFNQLMEDQRTQALQAKDYEKRVS